jgi:hypothetical protein
LPFPAELHAASAASRTSGEAELRSCRRDLTVSMVHDARAGA